jgi:hypothetical protein
MNDELKSLPVAEDFHTETRPMPVALAIALQERLKSTLLFRRLCVALGLEESVAREKLCALFVAHDVSPQGLDETQLWTMRTGLFEVAEQVLPLELREAARDRLQILMLEITPE